MFGFDPTKSPEEDPSCVCSLILHHPTIFNYKKGEREQEERSNRGSTDTSDCPAEIRDAAAAAETEVAIGLAHLLLLVAVNIGIASGVCVKKRQFHGV